MLTPLDICDAGEIHLLTTDAVTKLWIGWDTPKNSLETTNTVLDALKRRDRGEYQGWVARLSWDHRDGSQMVGLVELVRLDKPARGGAWFELNFWVDEAHWGYGYASEMAKACVEWVRKHSQLECLNLSWTHGNLASKRVIEKLVVGQEPEIIPAEKNGEVLAVYHYVLELQPKLRPLPTNADSVLLQRIARQNEARV